MPSTEQPGRQAAKACLPRSRSANDQQNAHSRSLECFLFRTLGVTDTPFLYPFFVQCIGGLAPAKKVAGAHHAPGL
jgi:hypothetical protein